jgi:hypothetical protein
MRFSPVIQVKAVGRHNSKVGNIQNSKARGHTKRDNHSPSNVEIRKIVTFVFPARSMNSRYGAETQRLLHFQLSSNS